MRTILLAGNPNCGKTTLFNQLTGANQHVGNWAGVTVERKEGIIHLPCGEAKLVDLPGIYSLCAYTLEECIACDCLVGGAYDMVINLVDGTSLERGLYLTLQLRELGRPMVVAVGMMDEVRACGGVLNCEMLERLLGISVVPIVARTGDNVEALLQRLASYATPSTSPRYSAELEQAVSDMIFAMADLPIREEQRRYYALTYLETGQVCLPAITAERHNMGSRSQTAGKARKAHTPNCVCTERLYTCDADNAPRMPWEKRAREVRAHLEAVSGTDALSLIAQERYQWIDRATNQCVRRPSQSRQGALSDKIDAVVLHRFFAYPIFVLSMFFLFSVCFGTVGRLLKTLAECFFTAVSLLLQDALTLLGASPWLTALMVDGVLNGIGSVLTFLPQIALIFLCMTLMEECGYLSRAAFLMDKPLRGLGLTGKSFIPMLMGFGCTTPAVMAARTLENNRDRRLTILLMPFLSCGAKLPIYALFAGVFFPARQGLAVGIIYSIGIIICIIYAWFLSNGPLRDAQSPFMMEFPPYRVPSLKNVLRNTGERCEDFLKKAGTLIFLLSIAIWLLQHTDTGLHFTCCPEDSIFAVIGSLLCPVFSPLGFGSREAAVALLAGTVTKEAVVSTLSVACTAGGTTLNAALVQMFSPLSAASFLVFSALYAPCISALATMRRELHSTKWMLCAAVAQTLIAYVTALGVYQCGMLWLNLFGN